MRPIEVMDVLTCVRYKPGWHLRVNAIDDLFLQWEFPGTCSKTGEPSQQRGRKWRLSSHMTESELVTTALLAAITAEEHEAREHFRYQGKRLFNPHLSVRALMSICDSEDSRDTRKLNSRSSLPT